MLLQEFACNGTVVEHPEYGQIIQLQGDQRNLIKDFLKKVGLAKEEQIKVGTRTCRPLSTDGEIIHFHRHYSVGFDMDMLVDFKLCSIKLK